MAFPCDKPCPTCPPAIPGTRGVGPLDPNDPFLNLSSEAPDTDFFISRRYTVGLPPLGSFFYAVGCVGFCVSDESQAEADLCAARQAVLCTASNWPTSTPNPNYDPNDPSGGPPVNRTAREVFGNAQQNCEYECPDGTINQATIPAGDIYASSQSQANAQAAILCQQKVRANAICLSDLSDSNCCFGQSFSGRIIATATSTVLFDIISGSLPDGITSSQEEGDSFSISGTPTVGGDFPFTVRARKANGAEAFKSYTISVLGVTNDQVLAEATRNVAYSEQLNIGGTVPLSIFEFVIASGALPSGLTLNSTTGLISGTPTLEEMKTFTVSVRYFVNGERVETCNREFSINVIFPPGIWSDLVWSTQSFQSVVPGTPPVTAGSVSASGNVYSFIGTTTDGQWRTFGNTDPMPYTGGALNCRMIVTVTRPDDGSYAFLVRVVHSVFGTILTVTQTQLTSNTNIFLFTVPASVGATVFVGGDTLFPPGRIIYEIGTSNTGSIVIEEV